jgi:hypothetical protein
MRKALVLFFLASMIGYAKGEPLKRFEVGFIVGGFEYGEAISPNDIRAECGGRFAFNLNQRIAFEYQMVFSRSDNYYDSSMQGSGHAKISIWHSDKQLINIFGIAGPGFIREQREYLGGLYDNLYKYRSIAVDYGGGLEISPHKRFSIRLDLTDFYAGQKLAEVESLRYRTTYPGSAERWWHHHLDFKAAIMFRF